MRYSNCLVEAIKAKIKDPKNIDLCFLPAKLNKGRFHIFWIDKSKKEPVVYHYKTLTFEESCWIDRIWYRGEYKIFYNWRIFQSFILNKCIKNKLSIEDCKKYSKRQNINIPNDWIENAYKLSGSIDNIQEEYTLLDFLQS